jgi:hypothetical protein
LRGPFCIIRFGVLSSYWSSFTDYNSTLKSQWYVGICNPYWGIRCSISGILPAHFADYVVYSADSFPVVCIVMWIGNIGIIFLIVQYRIVFMRVSKLLLFACSTNISVDDANNQFVSWHTNLLTNCCGETLSLHFSLGIRFALFV